jgi:ADP-heptose:LPS heptosyltransferase
MHLLVIRTSAMGDVALATPVITALSRKYPEISITFVTRPSFAPFFSSIKGLNLFLADFNGRHMGAAGIVKLYSDLSKQGKPDHVIDLHDVLRTRILRCLFSMSGTPVSVIDKGRSEKRDLITGRNKAKLKHTVERYCDVFSKAGFPVVPETGPSVIPSPSAFDMTLSVNVRNIGVAPFAKHKLKMWPEEYMLRLMSVISGKHKVKFWLFGGADEQERLNKMQASLPGSYVVSGRHNLSDELALMARLDLMISMDSSNMHMAALCGTKVVSIWGGTDPLTGFGAWQQPDEYAIRIPVEELTCRPCTVYGKGECRRGDFACMMWLTPEKVYEKMVNLRII